MLWRHKDNIKTWEPSSSTRNDYNFQHPLGVINADIYFAVLRNNSARKWLTATRYRNQTPVLFSAVWTFCGPGYLNQNLLRPRSHFKWLPSHKQTLFEISLCKMKLWRNVICIITPCLLMAWHRQVHTEYPFLFILCIEPVNLNKFEPKYNIFLKENAFGNEVWQLEVILPKFHCHNKGVAWL